jgi:DNA-binding response OmpR family regulator
MTPICADRGGLLEENGFATPAAGGWRRPFWRLGPAAVDLALIDLRLRGENGLTLALRIRETIRHAHRDADRARRRDGQDHRSGNRRRRLHDEALQPARTDRAAARRAAPGGAPGDAAARPQPARSADLRARCGWTRRGASCWTRWTGKIPLTNAEYRLLDYFLRHPGRIIPRTELLTELGNDLSQYMDRTIDVLILRLRRKIEAVPSKPVHLQTRRGQGYVFVTASHEARLSVRFRLLLALALLAFAS